MEIQDALAREMGGHSILAVERFQDDTRHMVEFTVRRASRRYGLPGAEWRLFLSEDGYRAIQARERHGQVKITRHALVVEGHIVMAYTKKHRRH